MLRLRFVLPWLLCCLSSFGYGQFTDNFSDGNFTANPVWSGDNTEWEVLTQRLHLNGPAVANTTSHLSTPSTAIENTTWEFTVDLVGTTAGGSFVEVFLTSDQANIESNTATGYFVRIGDALDEISLFYSNSGSNSKIIDGADNRIAVTNPHVKVTVTRDCAGLWTLWSDTSPGGTNPQPEGSVSHPNTTTSSFFGVLTTYATAPRNTWCFVDDISVTATTCPDLIPPTVLTVVPNSATNVTVTFSERVGLATAENASNYLFNYLFNPATATIRVGDSTKVDLDLGANSLSSCGIDFITIANVADRAGNIMVPDTLNSTYFLPGTAVWKSVVISEIMADPSPAPNCLPASEFIEIHNRSNFPVDLNGWKISDLGPGITIINTSYPLCPGEYAILCAPTANFTGYNNVIPVTGLSSTLLNNTGDNLGLRSNSGVLVDSVEYLLSWYQDAIKDDGGWSLELINPNDTCSTNSNWIASNDACGGTPGLQNSVFSTIPDTSDPVITSISVMGASNLLVCFSEPVVPAIANIPTNYFVNNGLGQPISAIAAPPSFNCVTLLFASPIDTGIVYTLTATNIADCNGNNAPTSGTFMISGTAAANDVIINEIFFDPDINATNLPNVEYVELYNRSADAFDLAGWKFRDSGTPQTLGNYLLLPGSYVILCDLADTASYSGLPYLGLLTWPSLNNTGDNLGLRDSYGSLVDSVEYLDTWYNDPNKSAGGWSIELINPGDTCNAMSNWAASVDPDGGTPGAVNSVFSTVPDTDPPHLMSVTVAGPNSVTACFDQALDPVSAGTLGNYSANNGLGTPSNAFVGGTGNMCVTLVFASPIDTGTVYTLTATGIEDCAGNSTTNTGTFLISGEANWRSVIINEIFFDFDTTVTNLPAVEYVELYNRSSTPFDLGNWKFRDSSSTKTLTGYVLAPGDYVILCKESDTAAYTGIPYLGLSSWPSLNDGGDNLGLRDQAGNLVDSVQYRAPLWYHDSNKDGGGWSIELINPDDSCNTVTNWAASNDPDGGTPGAINSIFSTAPDLTAPQILSVTVTGTNSVQVCFDEGLDIATANMAGNFVVNNGLGTAATATLITPGNTCVNLTFILPIDTGTIYTLTATGVEDCIGNNAPTTGNFVVNGPAPFRALLFNEIFADESPQIGLPPNEFLELHNPSATAWDLSGWSIHNGGRRVIGSYVLNPGGYVVLCDDADTAAFAGIPYVVVASWPGLTNGGDQLGLRDNYGNLVDTVAYDISWYQDSNKDDGGWSLELINPTDSCAQLGNWIASNDTSGGTPGRLNSVYNNSPDTTPPTLLSVTVIDSNHVELCFGETMDVSALQNTANYYVDSMAAHFPLSATVSGIGNACVTLLLPEVIDTGVIYTVTVTNIRDCKGNLAGPLTGQFVLGGNANRYQIVFNEIYPDETPVIGSLPEGEFVELYNNGPNVVSLAGWTVTDRNDTGTLPAFNLFPGGHVILCSSSNVADFEVFGDAIAVSGMPGLNNSGDSLELYDATGQLMDLAYYDLGWYHDPSKEDGGWSMERVDPAYPCTNGDNWRASTDANGATPGTVNSQMGTFSDVEAPSVLSVQTTSRSTVRVFFSELMDAASLNNPANYTIDNGIGVATAVTVNGSLPFSVDLAFGVLMDTNTVYCLSVTAVEDCPGNTILTPNSTCFGIADEVAVGDLIINEILYNPYTGGSDFVELYNNSDKIIDISTVYIGEIYPETDSIFNGKQASPMPKIILPRTYICLTGDKDSQVMTYLPSDPSTIFEMASFPSYDDTEGECVIYTDSNEVLDRFAYLDDWAFPNLDDKNGVSLERLDFDRPTQDRNNWHSAASTALYATPGYKNSEILVPEGDAEVWLQPETFSPDQDGFEDLISINYHFTTPGWNVRVTVFDNKGRPVRILQENTLIGTDQGTFTWDGTTDGFHKADVGVYVILFEAMNPSGGEKKKFKLGCVLAAKL
ncbi:MAG: lamin tail domain-containing protein [Bacteroidetes bacterium]|nr:lamin tail domain-containing protein [Bacteroidota bacterium]